MPLLRKSMRRPQTHERDSAAAAQSLGWVLHSTGRSAGHGAKT
ncbi:hypothetical protein THIX_10284 [Thiomonas sp. X19]|nr:hypothetical protein [Thiomonas sp. X19]SCC91243.1 hypothetical protein THIX_10284 [Thiomonas sp. X19]